MGTASLCRSHSQSPERYVPSSVCSMDDTALSSRAATPWTHTAMHVTIGYASVLTMLYFLGVLNKQIAFAKPRKVDLSEEVIVITGGASGLGLLIAEVYGMRGATVAVLDVRGLESGEARGVTAYKCDVGNKEQVARVATEIERDVCLFF